MTEDSAPHPPTLCCVWLQQPFALIHKANSEAAANSRPVKVTDMTFSPVKLPNMESPVNMPDVWKPAGCKHFCLNIAEASEPNLTWEHGPLRWTAPSPDPTEYPL